MSDSPETNNWEDLKVLDAEGVSRMVKEKKAM